MQNIEILSIKKETKGKLSMSCLQSEDIIFKSFIKSNIHFLCCKQIFHNSHRNYQLFKKQVLMFLNCGKFKKKTYNFKKKYGKS